MSGINRAPHEGDATVHPAVHVSMRGGVVNRQDSFHFHDTRSHIHERSIGNNHRGGNKPPGQGDCTFTARWDKGAHLNTVSWAADVVASLCDDRGRRTAIDRRSRRDLTRARPCSPSPLLGSVKAFWVRPSCASLLASHAASPCCFVSVQQCRYTVHSL